MSSAQLAQSFSEQLSAQLAQLTFFKIREDENCFQVALFQYNIIQLAQLSENLEITLVS